MRTAATIARNTQKELLVDHNGIAETGRAVCERVHASKATDGWMHANLEESNGAASQRANRSAAIKMLDSV